MQFPAHFTPTDKIVAILTDHFGSDIASAIRLAIRTSEPQKIDRILFGSQTVHTLEQLQSEG